MMAIKCCNGCVPPKRSPTCHGTCPDYIREKALHEQEREERMKKRYLEYQLDCFAFEGIHREMRHNNKRQK